MFPAVSSPYSNVSDTAWEAAREGALERMTGPDREPTHEEIDAELGRQLETRADWPDREPWEVV